MHSAFADDWLTVACVVAGVDGVLSKGATGRQLTEAVREVHAGRFARPEVAPEILRAAGDAIGPDDQPILGLLDARHPGHPEICRVLRLESGQLHERRARMLNGGRRRCRVVAYVMRTWFMKISTGPSRSSARWESIHSWLSSIASKSFQMRESFSHV